MVARIAAIRLISADAEALAGFYISALGFTREADGLASDAFCGALRRLLLLRLGRELVEIAEPLHPVAPRAAAGPPTTAFQHFAMVAPDMAAAMAQLQRATGWIAITRGGPQTLPPASGGVTAFKFRDPEGHPLEFLTFSPDATPPVWRGRQGVLAGIDHTAIVVEGTDRSVAFYASLGFARRGGSLNHGPEQAALDGVDAPTVQVTALALPAAPPPHLELLCYRSGAPDAPTDDSDTRATRTICAGATRAIRDPDGHRWAALP